VAISPNPNMMQARKARKQMYDIYFLPLHCSLHGCASPLYFLDRTLFGGSFWWSRYRVSHIEMS
jgi:hypothetical protein